LPVPITAEDVDGEALATLVVAEPFGTLRMTAGTAPDDAGWELPFPR